MRTSFQLGSGFEEDDAIHLVIGVAAEPVVVDGLDFESGSREFADEDFLRDPVTDAVFRNARRDRRALAGVFVDYGEPSAGLERVEKAGVDFGGLGEMVIDEAHEDRVAAVTRKVRGGFGGLHGDDIRLVFGQLFEGIDFLRVELGAIDLPGGRDAFRCCCGQLAFARADVRNDASIVPF